MKKLLAILFIASITMLLSCGSNNSDPGNSTDPANYIKFTFGTGPEINYTYGPTDFVPAPTGEAIVFLFGGKGTMMTAGASAVEIAKYGDGVDCITITLNEEILDLNESGDLDIYSGADHYSGNVNVIFSQYDETIGGRVKGTFTGTAGPDNTEVSGSFDVERVEGIASAS